MKKDKKYIVKLGEKSWIAPWDGDPGRTVVRENAQIFKSKASATRALNRAKKDYGFRNYDNAKIEEL